jgi:hypothetical protein
VTISRDRYFDDTMKHAVTLALFTRTHEMHSMLSGVPDDVHDRLGEVLVQALDQIQRLLAPMLDASRVGKGVTNFGCGT